MTELRTVGVVELVVTGPLGLLAGLGELAMLAGGRRQRERPHDPFVSYSRPENRQMAR